MSINEKIKFLEFFRWMIVMKDSFSSKESLFVYEISIDERVLNINDMDSFRKFLNKYFKGYIQTFNDLVDKYENYVPLKRTGRKLIDYFIDYVICQYKDEDSPQGDFVNDLLDDDYIYSLEDEEELRGYLKKRACKEAYETFEQLWKEFMEDK